MGNDNRVVVSHKLCGFQKHVGGRFVVMKEPAVVAAKVLVFFIAHFLPSISKHHGKSQS
jgi:hypothetical protein